MLISAAKASMMSSVTELETLSSDLSDDSPIIKQLKQRQERLHLMEKKLDMQMQMYTTRLKMVERAEQLLLDLGFHQVRVRIHGMTARIEVNKDEIIKIFAPLIRDAISAEFHQIGFTFVTVDIDCYKTGSINKTLPDD